MAMRRSNVLVSGINGLGVEIAKNLALAGVKSITLHHEETVGCWDLSSNIEACVQKLQELNSAVLIKALTEKLSKEQLSDFQAVVFTDLSLEKAIEFNDYCHNHKPPIPFIKSEVRGLFGNVFCDFGQGFTVFDADDEEPRTGIIVSISNDNPALVSCVDNERLEFQDGDLVMFSEIKGMTELNDGKPRKVINAGPCSFFLEEDSTHFCAYDRGGIVMQVKQPTTILNFKTLRDSLKDPGDFILTDFYKYDRPPLLHLAFQALDKYRHDFGRFPVAESEEDVQRLIGFAISINENSGDCKLKEVDEKLLRYFTTGSGAVLSPMAAMFGVIVSQEVVKACLGKSHPIVQFFYFDSIESLPVELQKPEDLKPLNSCHDAQISVFGFNLIKKLEQAIGFMAGAGALGCEFLKNFALMGVCCSRNGKFTTRDEDVIEESKLSRQFMFRDWNIGQSNSTVAATAASTSNPALPVEALQNRVYPVPEDVFNDAFCERRDIIVNTLDNVNGRLYAEYFQKLLLESGTLGTKCNTQMVIPHLTDSYGVSRDRPEKQAPMCTVHSFSHNIDHWLSNPKEYACSLKNASDAQARDELERALECLDKERCKTFKDCVTWARLKFEDHFSNRVKQLIYTFPDVAGTSTGASFWSAPKRFPQPLEFSASDPAHLHFIFDVSMLRAQTFGITVPDWAKSPKKLADAVSQVMVPDFEPKKVVNIVTDDKTISMSTASTDDATAINDLLPSWKSLQKKLPPAYGMNPIQFEKIYDTANISSGTTILAFLCERGDVGIIAAETRVSSGNQALGTFTCRDNCFRKINSIVHGRIYAAFSGTVNECKAVIKKLQDFVVQWTQDLNTDAKDIEVHRVVLEAKNIIRIAERRSNVNLLILGWDQPYGIRVYSVNSAGEHRHDHILTFGSGASSIAVQSWNIDFTEGQAYVWVQKVMAEAMYFDPNSGGKVCCATIFPHGKSKEQIDWIVVAELDGNDIEQIEHMLI